MDDSKVPSPLETDDDRDGSIKSTDAKYYFDETKYLFPEYSPCRWVPWPEVPKDQTWPKKAEQVKSPSGYTYNRQVDELNVFTYSQLPSRRFIRLIHLQPGQGDEPISCSLIEASIDHNPQYDAISYVWGQTWEMARLYVDGTPFKVTHSLYAVLQSIRSSEDEKILWADAICINQDDLAERSVQVQMMREIYERAHGVLVWLGPEDHEDEAAIVFINRLAEKCSLQDTTTNQEVRVLADSFPLSSLPDSDSREWKSLFRLFELPYFCRTWIIQEVQASKNCLVICGKSRTTYPAIELAALCAFRAPEAVRDKMITDRGISNAIFIRSLASPNTSLMTRLEQTRGFFATDPRDKFFAFLRGEDSVLPDYSKSLKDVLVDISRQILLEDGLDCLSHIVRQRFSPLKEKGRLLPSWTPTFSNCFIVPLYKIRGIAAGGLSNTQDFTIENGKLKVKAILLDRITVIHPSFTWDDLSVTPSFRNVPTYVDRLWHLYSVEGKFNSNYPVGSYSIQAAFSMVITAGLGRWGLQPEIKIHEQIFSEFTRLLFERAGDMNIRCSNERFEQDGPAFTNAMDLEGDTIKYITCNGGDQAGHEYEDRQEANGAGNSEPMPAYQRFQRAAQSVCNNRCVFETLGGYLGLGPSVMGREYKVRWDEEKGIYPELRTDESNIYEVWLPLGAKTPFVLQPCGSSYVMVGESYVQGFMDGEALRNGTGEAKEIVIF